MSKHFNEEENAIMRDHIVNWFKDHDESYPGRALTWAQWMMPRRRFDGEKFIEVNDREKFSFLRKYWDQYETFCKEEGIEPTFYERLGYGPSSSNSSDDRLTW